MSKSLTESAAEILKASLGGAVKEPMQAGGAQVTDLGGQTPTTEPEAIGAKASAQAKEAPKPGSAGAPKEAPVDPTKKKAEQNAVGSVEAMPGTSVPSNPKMAEETESDEVELTEEEIEEYLNSLSEEELEALAAEANQLDEAKKEDDDKEDKDEKEDDDDDDDDDDDEKEDKKDVKEEVEMTEEQIAEARKEALKQMVTDNMGSCKEDIDALFSGEELSEEFKDKATTIFEAAVRARVESIVEKVVTENEQIIAEAAQEFETTLTEQVDEYLNYVVEQWMEENKLAIETGLRVEIAEDFIGGLKNLFMEHYIEVPEEKADLVEEMATKVTSMEEKLNEQVEENKKLQKSLNESKAKEVLSKVVEGLTTVQAEKIKALAEGVEFTTEGEYLQKLAVIRENYFPSKKTKGEAPQALVETEEPKEVSNTMDWYVNALSKSLPK